MANDWQKYPEMLSRPPYDSDHELLAVANPTAEGGLDTDFPDSLHLARRDEDKGPWATNKGDDQSGGIVWLSALSERDLKEVNPDD
jgi:hypothetical protein